MMFDALLKYSFMQNALFGSLLASIACGIVGTIIVEKKLVMMSGGIAHISFGGVGMGYMLNFEPVIGALLFAISAALGVVVINRKTRINTDVIMGIFWSVGMALGVLFIAFTPGYPPDMSSYLFGDILTVSHIDLVIMLVFDILAVITVAAFYNYVKAYLFDEEFVSVLGISIPILDYLLFVLVAITIVILIRIVGIILVIALLTTPPAVSKMFSFNLKRIMAGSIVLSMFFCITGLWLSYELNIASGASIVLLAGATYVAASFIKRAGKKKISST